MRVPNQFREYFSCLEKDKKVTLKDEQTKLYIKAKETIWVITVDRGIIPNVKQTIRKCDYMIYGEIKATAHLIELKGRETVDAYIVSPNTQKIPKGLNSHERELAKSLASKCSLKPTDIISLINYVKIVPKQVKLVKEKQRIICSGQSPIEFE